MHNCFNATKLGTNINEARDIPTGKTIHINEKDNESYKNIKIKEISNDFFINKNDKIKENSPQAKSFLKPNDDNSSFIQINPIQSTNTAIMNFAQNSLKQGKKSYFDNKDNNNPSDLAKCKLFYF